MKEYLEIQYKKLLGLCNLDSGVIGRQSNINQIIKESVQGFIETCSVPAVWCYGKHTKMMMTDFMYEMKRIHYIVDTNFAGQEKSGFCIIREGQIQDYKIDGIIISSYKYKDEIKKNLKEHYPEVRYLDIYEELEKRGVVLSYEYFSQQHPYGHYSNINTWKRKFLEAKDIAENEYLYRNLVTEYILIKDFRSALCCMEQARKELGENAFQELLALTKHIYATELEAASKLSENNVVMLCMDGLREKDFSGSLLPQMKSWVDQTCYIYKNAYSVSTSTMESLIPAYSENDDLRTHYYETMKIAEEDCRFVCEAIRQKRNIYFYTDATYYIDSVHIKVTDKMQTATEKMWNFILDALDENNGLFYIHELYESHFSYPNPYTEELLVADGTNIMFDYLAVNGQRLRTDYDKQHKDALRYLDDVLTPLLERLKCRMVIYADHGNILLSLAENIWQVERTKFSFHRDLVCVPLIVKSPETGIGYTEKLESIMSLNAILISLMCHRPVDLSKKEYVKLVRSEIYNPDFRYLYHKCGFDQELLALEVFIFTDGMKLAIYSNGKSELFLAENDQEVMDDEKKKALIRRVKSRITVCDFL